MKRRKEAVGFTTNIDKYLEEPGLVDGEQWDSRSGMLER